uniref:Protein tyrosine phosphatase receptor type N n=1 Tax=Apteryx owenii TaxID=8824 RepID=A0A8B9PLE4_APTOW
MHKPYWGHPCRLLWPCCAELTVLGLSVCLSFSGCLFDRRLCSPQEVCVQDGLFGQCQVGSMQDRPYFQVTSPVLQRLQDVLRHLMAQGLSWQDGITQYVISQEMERIPRLRPPPSLEKLAARTLPPPGSSTACGSLMTSGTWRESSHRPWLPSQPLHRQVACPAARHQPSSPFCPHSHVPCGSGSLSCLVLCLPAPGCGLWAAYSPRPHQRPAPGAGSRACGPCADAGLDLMLCPLTDAALKRLASVLASYGLGLPELSPQQLSSLSTLLQLLQGPGEWGHKGRGKQGACSLALAHHVLGLGAWGLRVPLSPLQPVPQPVSALPRPLGLAAGVRLLEVLAKRVHLSTASFINISVVGPALTFRIRQNPQNLSLADVASRAGEWVKAELEAELGLKIMQTGVGQVRARRIHPSGFHSVLLTFIALACVAGITIAAAAAFCLRHHAKQREKERLAALGPEGAADSTFEYQELCRQHMAAKSLFGRAEAPAAPAETSRVSSVSSQFSDAPQPSPSSHSSTPSWCEEPVQSNMDISTGHMILAYMEDHLRNRDRLAKEWQALCAYQAEPNVCSVAQSEANLKKNRNPDYVPYDHVRIKLKAESNPSRSDFINASPIIEHDPRMPAYIATQGPLSHTIADFWQMVWEHGCTVIVMLSPLAEDSVKQCDRYWPDEGSSLYHIYEVNLVSEHIWCEDFLVRSFYLKNVQSQETRTLTQFHFLSWPAEGIPATTRPLLDFRRKVNKCYRGRSCPIIVHCSDGAGRTGTYILVDMVLNRMAKGVKEIDIAATLEHIRDQRPGMVQTKDQFEFVLTAVAEEVNAILKALPQ